MRPQLLQDQGPLRAARATLEFPDAEARDQRLAELIAAAGPGVRPPIDARRTAGGFGIDLAAAPDAAWPPAWPVDALERGIAGLAEGLARLHAQGLTVPLQVRVGAVADAAPAVWSEPPTTLVDADADWAAFEALVGRPVERPSELPPLTAKIPRALAAWYSAALAGRQGPQTIADPRVAAAFSLRCAARGALVLAVDGGDGLELGLRRAARRRLPMQRAAQLAFVTGVEGLLLALAEVSGTAVLCLVHGALSERDEKALAEAPRASGLAVIRVVGPVDPWPTTLPHRSVLAVGEDQDATVRRALVAGDDAVVESALTSVGRGPARVWAGCIRGATPAWLEQEIDGQLAEPVGLDWAAVLALGAIRVRLALAADEMDLAFAFADRVLQTEGGAEVADAWRAVVSARVDHEVGTPLGATGPDLLDRLRAHREVADAVDHGILLAETLTLLALAGEGALAQRGLDGAAAWALSLPQTVGDWLAQTLRASGLRWPEAMQGGDVRLWRCAAALSAATTLPEIGEAMRAALAALTGRLVGLDSEDGVRLSALPEYRFSEVDDSDLPGLAALDGVLAAATRRVRRADALTARVTALYQRIVDGVEVAGRLPELVAFAVESTGAARGQLVVLDEQGQVIHSAGSVQGYSATLLDVVRRQQHSIILPDAMEDPRLSSSASAFHLGLRGVLLCPVRDGAELTGALLLEGTGFEADATRTLDALAPHIARIVGTVRRGDAPAAPLAQLPVAVHPMGFVASAPAMLEVVAKIEQVAHLDVPILVLGETGTGKEVVARALHAASPRAHGPFQAINCGALPETILEGELFGYRKGAFTGATRDNPGLLRAAHRGVLFLDEIGEMGLEMQKRLLRVLQEREVQPLGGGPSVSIDVRILAATHQGLRAAVTAGRFREDLYYRLRVIEIRMPPLRERIEDVPALSRVLLERAAEKLSGPPARLERRALKALMAHSWPGNVRELEHTLMRASALCRDGIIAVADLELEGELDGRRATPALMLGGGDRSAALLAFAAAREAFVCKDWAGAAGISPATALRDLNAMVERGTLHRMGVRRNARYTLAGAEP